MNPMPWETWGRPYEPPRNQKRPRSAISDGICEYTKKRDKKRKGQRSRAKAGRRNNR